MNKVFRDTKPGCGGLCNQGRLPCDCHGEMACTSGDEPTQAEARIALWLMAVGMVLGSAIFAFLLGYVVETLRGVF